MEVRGYKCFNKNLTNSYGEKFEIGKQYETKGQIKFGTKGNGFHFCKNIEDTFRFFDTEGEISVCEVIGSGDVLVFKDEYNEYFDMYCAEKLMITRQLDRMEIIRHGLKLVTQKAIRFIATFKLLPEEIELFKIQFQNDKPVLRAIAYYQEGDKEVYEREFRKRK